MSQTKKSAQLHSLEVRRRSKAKRGSATGPRAKRIDQILAEANIDDKNRKIFADAAARYAPLMKRLADK